MRHFVSQPVAACEERGMRGKGAKRDKEETKSEDGGKRNRGRGWCEIFPGA